jgi:carboxymethylenebutenolidase
MYGQVMSITDITISTHVDGMSTDLKGVIGRPDGPGPWPGVVVVHEAFGVNDVMRRQVEKLVSMGYIVLMPDLFTAGGARKCLIATFRALNAGAGRAFSDIEAARLELLANPYCTGAVGVIGFCMGGGFALATAKRGFEVSSANYGMLPKDLDAALEGACPIIGSYGGRDSSLKGVAAKLETALAAHDIRHDVKEYPDAGHAFLNDAPSGPVLMRPLMRVSHMGPNPEAAADAWERIEEFFAVELKG